MIMSESLDPSAHRLSGIDVKSQKGARSTPNSTNYTKIEVGRPVACSRQGSTRTPQRKRLSGHSIASGKNKPTAIQSDG